jgi:hypothetical protein
VTTIDADASAKRPVVAARTPIPPRYAAAAARAATAQMSVRMLT